MEQVFRCVKCKTFLAKMTVADFLPGSQIKFILTLKCNRRNCQQENNIVIANKK